MIMQLIRIGHNHDTCYQLENWSAPARLGLESSQLGLALAGKFQLELISNGEVRLGYVRLG